MVVTFPPYRSVFFDVAQIDRKQQLPTGRFVYRYAVLRSYHICVRMRGNVVFTLRVVVLLLFYGPVAEGFPFWQGSRFHPVTAFEGMEIAFAL